MITTSVILDHRRKPARNKPSVVEIRVTANRRSYYVSTGIRVLPSEFCAGSIVNRGDAPELNERLLLLSRTVEQRINECFEQQRPIDMPAIRRSIWALAAADDAAPFIDWFAEHITALSLAPGTIAHYNSTLTRLRACAILKRWTDLTTENVYKFDAYLHKVERRQSDAEEKMNMPAKKICDAAIYNHHKCLRAMISRAVRLGLCESNPYDRLRGQFSRGEKETVSYLTEEEVAAFESLRPVPGTVMASARDLFIFQLYTGLAYSDAQRFNISNYRLVDGRWISVQPRIKTGVPYVSQLLPPAVDVLERYSMQVPRLDNQTYNVCLKALGAAAGIATPLHSHMARHTFATFMLKNGVKIENLARMLGHTNITQTQRYAKVLAQSVHDDFDKIATMLKKKGSV